MYVSDTEAEAAFRREARSFIAKSYPSGLRGDHPEGYDLGKEEILSWHRILAAKGWIAPHWPREHGGAGWTPVQCRIWAEELATADTVPIFPTGIDMIGPVIYTFGTLEQKQRFLPGTLSGDIWWCQGFSEPGAGSDLAALRTRAVRDPGSPGHYLVTGQKTWTTMAHYADWGFFLVRTEDCPRSSDGITMLLIDMASPGVRVEPIETIDGWREVNEVWLDNVRVPVAQRIHDENQGWQCARFLLSNERTGFAEVARSARALERLRTLAGSIPSGWSSLLADPHFRRRITEAEVELAALDCAERRMLGGELDGAAQEAWPSLLKIRGSELQQLITELNLEAHLQLPAWEPDRDRRIAVARSTYLNMRKTSIYGGSNEIQRNLIARALLGPSRQAPDRPGGRA